MSSYRVNVNVDGRALDIRVNPNDGTVYEQSGKDLDREDVQSALLKVARQQDTLRLCLEQQRLAWETEALKLAGAIAEERKRFDDAEERARQASRTDDAAEATLAAAYVASSVENLRKAAVRLRAAVERRGEVENLLAILDLGLAPVSK